MVEQGDADDWGVERRLQLIELAVAQSVVTSLQLINAVKALGLEAAQPDAADALTQSFSQSWETFRDVFEVAAPEAAKVGESQGV